MGLASRKFTHPAWRDLRHAGRTQPTPGDSVKTRLLLRIRWAGGDAARNGTITMWGEPGGNDSDGHSICDDDNNNDDGSGDDDNNNEDRRTINIREF